MAAMTQNFFDTRIPPWKQVVLLAWPTIVEMLLQTAVNYVDTAMVSSIGIDATASISVSMSTIWLINGIMNAVGIGFSVLVAQSIGQGNFEYARSIIRQALLATAAIGALLTVTVIFFIAPWLPLWMGAEPEIAPMAQQYLQIIAASYLFELSLIVCSCILRCAGDTKTPMKFNMITNIINVIGNFFLIYPSRTYHIGDQQLFVPGAGLGVGGAAIATSLSIAFSGIGLALLLFLRRSPLQIRRTDSFRPQWSIMKDAVRLGIPAATERIMMALGRIASTRMITGLGTLALAANQLTSTAESICYLPAYGFSAAGTTLVAQCIGGKKNELAYRYGKWCDRLGIGCMLVASALMYLLASPMIDLFIDDAETIALGARMLRIAAFSEPMLATSLVLAGVMRGAGDTKHPLYISLLGMWVIRIPLAYALIHLANWGLEAIWVSMIADWAVEAVLFQVRFRRKRWITG